MSRALSPAMPWAVATRFVGQIFSQCVATLELKTRENLFCASMVAAW